MNARNRELESLESLKMRKDTSQTIENITAEILSSILRLEYSKQPTISGKEYSRMMHHQDIGLLLNLLKISSESSYEYLQALQSGIFSEDSPLFPEWKLVANQLQYNLHLLSNLVIFSFFFLCLIPVLGRQTATTSHPRYARLLTGKFR